MALSKRYDRGVITVPYTKSSLSRSMMSQVADRLLSIQDVEAVFVIANDTDGETAISARSAGNINVQVIMESMNGGGHMTAAAMQRKRCNIEDLEKELLEKIDAYFKEVEHEGHSEK
jgi:c-di-AMP phosphodiesterase-like protein